MDKEEMSDQDADGLVVSEHLDLLTARLALQGYIKQDSTGQWRVTEAGRMYLMSFDNQMPSDSE